MGPTKRRVYKLVGTDFCDDGISVKDAIKLIRNSEFFDEIKDVFNLDDIENDFIEVKGAKRLVDTLIEADEEFEKIDIDSPLKNVRLHKYTDDNQIILDISSIENKGILKRIRTDSIQPVSLYSVRSEYLNMYGADKYFEHCKKHNYQDIINANIDLLNSIANQDQKTKKFRVLRKDNNYYIRAITSTGIYKDYNLRFSLFVVLIELHRLTKYKGHNFYVESYNLNESDLTVLFKSPNEEIISKDTKIGFAFELVNDEIKRDAVKLNGLFFVNMANKAIFAKSEDPKKCNLVSFSHSVGLDKVKERLNNLNASITSFINNTIDDAKAIKILKSPDRFREYILWKIQNSKNLEFNKNYREQAKQILSDRVNTIFELAIIFAKVESLIRDEHISSLEFWRYKLYQALMDGVKNRD